MSQEIKKGMICRIVGVPQQNNKLVRTIYFDTDLCEWSCEALETIPWVDGSGLCAQPGDRGFAPEHELRPLYDGDADDETLAWAGKPAAKPVDIWDEMAKHVRAMNEIAKRL